MNQFLRIIRLTAQKRCSDRFINLAKISMIQPGDSDLQTCIWTGNGDDNGTPNYVNIPFNDVSKAIIDNVKDSAIITISEL